ncbi:MAG: hypothetical protein Kow0068_16320 [Marinilabiliales bacterium]
MYFKFFFILISFLSVFSISLYSQCFTSPGNPVGGNASLGTLPANVHRITFFHKYNYTDVYFSGDNKADNIYDHALYNYIGNTISLGLTGKINLDIESGYFINKVIQYPGDNPNPLLANKKITGSGFSNCNFIGKYNLYNNKDKMFEWTVGSGIKIPFSKNPITENTTILPLDVQPSTNSFGYIVESYLIKENSMRGLRFFLYNRIESNFKNSLDYKYGNTYINSFFISKHLWFPWTTGDGIWTTILQFRNETRTRTIYPSGEYKEASGGILFFISPQINITIAKKWNISVYSDIPVYQYLNGTQLANKYIFYFTVSKDFIFNKEIRAEMEQMRSL